MDGAGVQSVFFRLSSLNICCIDTLGCGVLHMIACVVLSALLCLCFVISNKIKDLIL